MLEGGRHDQGSWVALGGDCGNSLRVPREGGAGERMCSPVFALLDLVHARSAAQSSNSATLRTVAHQSPLSMEFSRQEYWSGLPFPLPGDLPEPGIEPMSLVSLALGGQIFYH